VSPYIAAYDGGATVDYVGSRPFPHVSFLSCRRFKRRGGTTASLPHVSTVAAVFVGTQATRPPWSWTLPAMLVQDALTAPNAFTFVAARDFVSASGLGTEATLSGLLRRDQLPRHV
jgi:hypothetical protein